MTLNDVLLQGFSLAHRRLPVILFDLFWKAVWLAITLAALVVAASRFVSDLRAVQWLTTSSLVLDRLLAEAFWRQFWHAHRSELLWTVVGVIAVSVLAWLFLEAYFRHLVVAGFSPRSIRDERGLKPAATSSFKVFLASGLLKTAILAVSAITLVLAVFGRYLSTPVAEWGGLWSESWEPAIVGIVTFTTLAFLLTIIDTLVRSDAVELLGTDLLRVTGLIGTLFLFEALIAASFAVVVIAGLLNVARAIEAILMLGVAALAASLLSLFHSYLLLVRFAAVGIMKARCRRYLKRFSSWILVDNTHN